MWISSKDRVGVGERGVGILSTVGTLRGVTLGGSARERLGYLSLKFSSLVS